VSIVSMKTARERRATAVPRYRAYEPQKAPVCVADGLWTVEGATVLFGKRPLWVPCPTRMTVIALEDRGLALHSPVAFDDGLLSKLQSLGPIRCLIAPNSFHFLHVGAWAENLPDADVFVARGVERKPQLPARSRVISGQVPESLAATLEMVEVDGGWKELVFLHRRSRTVIFTDLVQNFDLSRVEGRLAKAILRLAGAAGAPPGASIELRMLARLNGKRARVAEGFRVIRDWQPDRVLIAHGAQPQGPASTLLENAFCWTW